MASNIEIHVHRTRDGLWRARVNVGAISAAHLANLDQDNRVNGEWVYTGEYSTAGHAITMAAIWVDV